MTIQERKISKNHFPKIPFTPNVFTEIPIDVKDLNTPSVQNRVHRHKKTHIVKPKHFFTLFRILNKKFIIMIWKQNQ